MHSHIIHAHRAKLEAYKQEVAKKRRKCDECGKVNLPQLVCCECLKSFHGACIELPDATVERLLAKQESGEDMWRWYVLCVCVRVKIWWCVCVWQVLVCFPVVYAVCRPHDFTCSMNCKVCETCKDSGHERSLLFCDECDKGTRVLIRSL